MLRSIIIDDEFRSRNILQHLLEKYCANIELVAVVDSAHAGKIAVEKFHPQIVFLDIEMPEQNGFDFLASYDTTEFQTIAVTAHSEYRTKVHQYNAAAFLLKPIDIDELKTAIVVAEERIVA